MLTAGLNADPRNFSLHVKDGRNRMVRLGRCRTTRPDLGTLLPPSEGKTKAKREPIRVARGSTTNARGTRGLRQRSGCEVGLDLTVDALDAGKLSIITQNVRKSDAADAQALNELAQSRLQLPTCDLPDDGEFDLRGHLRARHDLVRMRTMLKKRVDAVLHRRAIMGPANGLFSSAGKTIQRELSLDETGRTILERFLRTIEQIDALIERSTCSLNALACTSPWAEPMALLETIPGVGRITSLTILAELTDVICHNPDTPLATYSMAHLLQQRGRLDGSEALPRRTRETRRGVLGDSHEDTLYTPRQLAGVFANQRRAAEAEAIFAKAVAVVQMTCPKKPVAERLSVRVTNSGG